MKLKPSLRAIEFTAMLAAAGMAQATEADLDVAFPGASFATAIAGQPSEVFGDPHGFSLLTSGDGSLQSSLTNTLVGSTYNALSKTFLYTGLVPSEGYFRSSGFALSSTVIGSNGKASITTVMSKPQGYAMFFAGLGIMGMVVRRRARSF